jgi:PLP dependent protein
MSTDPRSDQLARSLAEARRRVDAACAAADRPPRQVTLVVVTKTFPAADVARLAALGVRDVGENRDQEAAAKAEALGGLGLRWHFVGQLQRNKAASVARYADVVHSLDRLPLVAALDRAAGAAGRRLAVLLQVDLSRDDPAGGPSGDHSGDLSGDVGRGGVRPAGLAALADASATSANLDLRGVMAVAPLGEPARPAFERLAALAERLRGDHPGAQWMSAGMSADLEDAIACGATHLRVGGAVLGSRAPLG